MSTFQLQIWDGENYFLSPHESDLPGDLKTIAKQVDSRAYRIVDLGRDKPLARKPKANWASSKRRTMNDGLTLKEQAELGATHYAVLRKSRDVIEVPVYPVKPSGRGLAAEFRLILAARLTGESSTVWGFNDTTRRRDLEVKARKLGFDFVEVDLDDY